MEQSADDGEREIARWLRLADQVMAEPNAKPEASAKDPEPPAA